MDRNTHLLCESVQEVTLAAWPVIWDNNKYDQDSRVVLEVMRDWGEQFENWWIGHDDDWIDSHDYVEEIWKYTDLKCKEYLRNINASAEGSELNRESNIQEFTALAVDRSHYDNFFGYLMGEKSMSREEGFKVIRDWADEFWGEYIKMDAFELYEKGESYYDCVDEFIAKKISAMKAKKE